MDIKEKVEELVEKIKNDKNILAKFEKNPAAVIEDLIGIDLPDDKINAVIDGIKAKLNLDDLAEKAEGILGALGGLFGKK